MNMIFTYQIPEEYRALTLWERPIGTISRSSRLLSAQFVPNQSIFPDGAIVTLLIIERPSEKPLAIFDLSKEIGRFQVCLFDLIHHENLSFGSVLTLRKEVAKTRTLALPNSVVQVELG